MTETTVKLRGIEAAALTVLAESAGLSPEHLLQDLIRDAALVMVTGRARRKAIAVSVSPDAQRPADEVRYAQAR